MDVVKVVMVMVMKVVMVMVMVVMPRDSRGRDRDGDALRGSSRKPWTEVAKVVKVVRVDLP